MTTKKEDMKPEYDFTNIKGAVRGKYCKAYRTGHKVEFHHADCVKRRRCVECY